MKQKRRLIADTALRPARYFGNSPRFWLGLQNDYDLEEALRTGWAEFDSIQQFAQAA